MTANSIPEIYLPAFANFIRQGRSARKLSVGEAASRIGISAEKLLELESGLSPATDILIQLIVVAYGGVRSDAVDSLLFKIAMERLHPPATSTTVRHLRLV